MSKDSFTELQDRAIVITSILIGASVLKDIFLHHINFESNRDVLLKIKIEAVVILQMLT